MFLTKSNLITMLFLVICNAANAAGSDSPENTAKQYFEYLNQNNYEKAAEAFRENDLAEFKSIFMPIFTADEKSGKRELIRRTFGFSSTLKDVKDSTPKQFFSNVMSFLMNRNPVGKGKATRMKILGVVNEKDKNLTHVISRNYIQIGGIESNKVEVMTTTKVNGEWKMVMPEQMKAMGLAIQRNMAMRQQNQR